MIIQSGNPWILQLEWQNGLLTQIQDINKSSTGVWISQNFLLLITKSNNLYFTTNKPLSHCYLSVSGLELKINTVVLKIMGQLAYQLHCQKCIKIKKSINWSYGIP